MEEERIPKKVLNGNFFTTRPVGRSRNRWADVVQRDALQQLGIRGRRRRAENRGEWRRLMGEAKARKGLQRHIWNGITFGEVFKSQSFFTKQLMFWCSQLVAKP